MFAAFSWNPLAGLAIGEVFLSLGLMMIFLSISWKTPGKMESFIERLTGVAMILIAMVIMIAAINQPSNDVSWIIAGSVFTIVMGIVIWWLTRIRIKKTP